jgi:CBS domain-containing protein
MNAYELCQRNVVTVRGHEDLATAAWMMRERNVGCLVVVEPISVGGGWHPVGMITDRDIVTNVVARDCDPRSVVVADAMSRPVLVPSGTPVEDVLQRMREAGVRRVAVIEERGRLAGILALDDIFELLTRCVAVSAVPRGLHQPGRMGTDRI